MWRHEPEPCRYQEQTGTTRNTDGISHLVTPEQAGWWDWPAAGSQMSFFSGGLKLLAHGFCPAGSAGRDETAELRAKPSEKQSLKSRLGETPGLGPQCILGFLWLSCHPESACLSMSFEMRLRTNWTQKWVFPLWRMSASVLAAGVSEPHYSTPLFHPLLILQCTLLYEKLSQSQHAKEGQK